MIYTESYPIHFRPTAHAEAVVLGPAVRFTVLTSRLMRLEYSPDEAFEDRPSQAFWHRAQPVPDFEVRRQDDRIQIETEHLELQYELGDAGFDPQTLSITLKGLNRTWRYGDADLHNLGGTARTLDGAHGPIALGPGLVSRDGWAVVDDTDRLVLDERGWLGPREAAPGSQDLYFFGYGHDYAECLRDYYKVAGQAPLLPRWSLGNWWSRYWAYSADELLQLMRDFQKKEMPLSVCIVDMDWHITDTGNRSSGWTGYTWNRELFPDPQGFIEALHQLGLKTALNLHPALGVFPHEAQYPEMAKRMGMDPATGDPVPFDIADPEFTRAYFQVLHHPHEAQGVDFWWIDWQQGTTTKMPGLDPLWWLNHLHFYDLARDGEKRPFIFSRWGGLGNHRYPIGFSGDSVVSWETLAFQPYFTATAANVGFGWWSHDIGGHMGGIEDAELYARWVQYGVFSPIFRLHATKNAYHERRPWGYDAETSRVTREAMQLRHALVPYLYTMSWRDHNASTPLARPMYYDYPKDERGYHCPDQYTFGSELIAAPYIAPADPETRLSRGAVWLPPGEWFGFFDGLSYPGDGWHALYGGLEDIPVFAKAGAIVPLAPRQGWAGVDTPQALELHIFPGADNRFELYEDDGRSAHSLIPLELAWEPGQLRFEVGPAQGATDHLPAQRRYTLHFRGIARAPVAARKNGAALPCAVDYDENAAVLTVKDVTLTPTDRLEIAIASEDGVLLAASDYRLPACRKLLRACRMDTELKGIIDPQLSEIVKDPSLLAGYELFISENVLRAFAEITTGAGVHKTRDPAAGGRRVVLWNNNNSGGLTYKFVGLPEIGFSGFTNSGPLPRFAVFLEKAEHLEVVLGHGPLRFESVADWVEFLPRGFRPETARDVDVVIQFHFDGKEPYRAHAHIAKGVLSVTDGTHDRPDLTVEAAARDWLAVIHGLADPVEWFLSGRLSVDGDMNLVVRLPEWLGGSTERRRFRVDRWRLSVDYLGAYGLELGRLE
jgi:putative sterol carrier protein